MWRQLPYKIATRWWIAPTSIAMETETDVTHSAERASDIQHSHSQGVKFCVEVELKDETSYALKSLKYEVLSISSKSKPVNVSKNFLRYWWILGYWMTFWQLHMLSNARYYEKMVTSCNLKGLQRKWSWPTLSYCSSTCHEELRTATKNRNRNWCPSWDFNEIPPSYKLQVLLLRPTSFLQFHVCLSDCQHVILTGVVARVNINLNYW